MNENNPIFSIINNLDPLNSFQNILKRQIFQPIECYLLDKNLLRNLNNNYNTVSNKSFCFSFYPEINQCFIDNFIDAINLIQNDHLFSYVKKNIMELLIDKNELLKYHNITNIYVANKKIIINFYENDIDKSILIINPFENFDKRNIFIISCSNKRIRKNIFESLLSDNNNYYNFEILKRENEKYIIKFEDYLNFPNYRESKIIKFSSFVINNNENDTKEIFEILVFIYYYEQYLSKKSNCFSEYQTYYLNKKL